ncbi:MAG: carnitine 3-dehydrogenase [Rhodothermales bacterium]|jgi:carnitine 3-dehydrogenase
MTQQSAAPGKACIVGGGVIGAGWAARFLLHGWQVSVFDPAPNADVRLMEVVTNARISLPALADVPMPAEGTINFAATLEDAVKGVHWIQESVPEVLTLKHKILAEIQMHAPESAIIGSSTSGFKPSQLQEGSTNPQQIVVAHPFNPVYLLPVVELVPGDAASKEITERAREILISIGMKPIVVRKEIDAHIADRLLEATWREALWLIKDDIATTEELDDVIRFGFGLRWGQMGLFETYRLAGGEAGMAHFIGQFGPCLQWPWTRLMDVPELDDELIKKIADQSDAQSGAYEFTELERIRDRNLVGMMRSLKERHWGAGALLTEHDGRLSAMTDASQPDETVSEEPLRMLDLTVLPAWIDYNGHMTEFRYVQVFSDSCDRFLLMIGMDKAYVASGMSWYTVESHVMFHDEVAVNQPIYSTMQILSADAKRFQVFYRLHSSADDCLLASSEIMYLHVDRESGRVCPASDAMRAKLMAFAASHSQLPRPEKAGRYVGQRKQD